jgi:hypothetical protein
MSLGSPAADEAAQEPELATLGPDKAKTTNSEAGIIIAFFMTALLFHSSKGWRTGSYHSK